MQAKVKIRADRHRKKGETPMDYQAWPSLTGLFFQQVDSFGDGPFLWAKREGAYRPLSWRETAERVSALSRGLRGLGLQPGDRVVLVSENRPEWLIADLAIMAAGAITVPAYTTNTTDDHNHILTNSGALGALVSSRALARRLLPAAIEAPDCKWLVSIDDLEMEQKVTVDLHLWSDVLARGREQADDVAERVAAIKREDVACLIYTSGTGGTPRGVMLTHGNILCNCMGAYGLLESIGLGNDTFLCFLPLSHAYEHTAGQFFPISVGAQIYYAESIEQLLNNLAEVRPTIMTAVPRLYESMHQRIMRGVEKQGGLKKKLFETAVRLGRKAYHDPASLSPGETVLNALVERLVRKKVRGRFGGRLKAMVSGGAALNTDIGTFFVALGLPILQGYGQTEAAPVISANPPNAVKMHTVGPALKGVEIKIAEDGEILVRGELVMKGYWRDEDATAQVLRDGWLHTGDIGELDADGYLRITDRKKDIIVFSGGDNVSPARVEGFLTLETEISQAMVFGDKRPNLVALLVPEEEFLAEWAAAHGKRPDLAALADDPELRGVLSQAVDRVNQKLSNMEKVRRFTVAGEAFSTDNEMMTPTMKVRRHKILEVYRDQLEALYEKK
jgi:long-chain acyl-CoA synthetase